MQVWPFPFPPLVLSAFVAGILVSGGGITWFLIVRRRGRLCPGCSATTLPLVPEYPLKVFRGALVFRWCPGCGWKGLAFRPAHERRSLGGKVRLGGGFHWGLRPPPKAGFLFRDQEESQDKSSRDDPPNPPPDDTEGGAPPQELKSRLSFRWRR